MFGDHSELEPPDPIPNSEVKRLSADGSVGSPHVRVGHRQAFNTDKPPSASHLGVFSLLKLKGDEQLAHGHKRAQLVAANTM